MKAEDNEHNQILWYELTIAASLYIFLTDSGWGGKTKYIVTCIPIARKRVCRNIPATQAHATIGYPLLDNEPANMHS
jgi:hypothetical protein